MKAVRNDGRHAPVPGWLSDETVPMLNNTIAIASFDNAVRPPWSMMSAGNSFVRKPTRNDSERKTADRGVENRINGGTLYAGFLRCDASGIPDHRI